MSQSKLTLQQNFSQKNLVQSQTVGSFNGNYQCIFCNIINQNPLFLQCNHSICWNCADQSKINLINSISSETIQQIECRSCKQITQFSNITELYRLGSPQRENKIQESQVINNSPPQRNEEQILQSQAGQSLQNYSLQQSPLKRSLKQNKIGSNNEQTNSSFLKKSLSKQSAQQVSENYESENPIFETLKPQIIEANICCEHGEEISLFCNTERLLCCVQCVYQTQIHKKHNVVPIKQALQHLREDNLIFINSCREKVSLIDEAIKNCQFNKNKLQQLVNQYRSMIQQEFDKLIQIIQKREEEALSHIQNFHDTSFKDYESKQENLQFLKNCIKEYSELDRAQESAQQETTIYLFSIQNMLKNSIKNFQIKTPVLKCDTIEIVEMNSRHQIQNELQNLGKSKVKSYLASAMIQTQQTSAKKQPTNNNTNININTTLNTAKTQSRSRSPIMQQKEVQAQTTPKAVKKSPNQKSYLSNVKCSSKEYQWKEMANKMNTLAEGISQAQRPISPLSTEPHQKERMVKRLKPSRSSLNFSSNKQLSQATPKQKQTPLQNDLVQNNNVKKPTNSALSPAPSQKSLNKGLEIKTNISPNFNENNSRRSVTPNSFNKQQGFNSNLGYSGNYKSQITPKRSSGYNPFVKDKGQAKKNSNYQSRGSQKGEENYQTTSQNNNFEQNPISEIRDKFEQFSNIQDNNHNRNRSESPMYINVNEFQTKSATYKSQHDMRALKQNSSNSNLKNTPIQSSVGVPISSNLQSTQFNQQQKSLSYQNLHQIRQSSDLKLIQNSQQQLQQASQNSTPTLKAEKAQTPTSQNLLQSSQTAAFSQLTSNVYTNESPLVSSQQNEEQLKKIQSGQILDQTSYFQQLGQEKEKQISGSYNQQYLVDLNTISNDQNLIRKDIHSSYQQQQLIQQQQQEQQQQQQQMNTNQLQQFSIIPNQQQMLINGSQQFQNYQVNNQLNYEQQIQLQKSYGQQGQQQQILTGSLVQKQQQSINEVEKTNDTLFQNQRSSIYNYQHEPDAFSPFKQQNQLSPIVKQQINSQYLENQSNIQSPPTNYFPQQFNVSNQIQNDISHDQVGDKQFNLNQQIVSSFNNGNNNNQVQHPSQQYQNQEDQRINNIQQSNNTSLNNLQANKSYEQQLKNSISINESQNKNIILEQNQQNLNISRSQSQNQNLQKAPSFEKSPDVRQMAQPIAIINQNQVTNQQQQIQQQQQNYEQQYLQVMPQTIEQNQQQQLISSNSQNQTSSSQNDNNVLNSQFSFTPSSQNFTNNNQEQKQEQVTVFNTINNGTQYQMQQQQFNQRGEFEFNQINQNNQYQNNPDDNSFNLPTPTQLSFQNQEQVQSSYIERTSNNTSSNNTAQQQQIYKTQSQNFAPTFPHNNSNNNSNNQYILIQQQEQLQEINTGFAQHNNNQVEQQASLNVNQLSVFSDSHIFTYSLQTNPQCTKILPPNIKKAKLLYRLTEDGANSQIFHRKCDGQGPTITFVKANGEHIFGYYLPIAFCRSDQYSTTDKCYIFTAQNSQNIPPTKFEIRPEKKFISIYQNSKNPCLGSTLNGKQDLIINFDNPEKSCSNLGYAYKIDSNIVSDKILAGQYTDWNVSEIEVYSLTM
ncbi:B-box zinc finger protein (macronuclear) [Tetrahymena thermophila SB210]|uniref:B-box zinc finger protein n=1 Tax=Tetrahymena thermophila (strain SB210) TaxID=312017 RepID=Q22SJ9_TETTS|nr:B-box zinc finger protein [Tetrahymena thermophila SB210]EAR87773.2 B-box zinc finger protein [Tetrahymena thermophila SB210]|eukprot:XP_001008018.2 B-box zinc finger protein [Tetrahymena thermophila SB210]